MTLEDLKNELTIMGASENTLKLAINCYELGRTSLKRELIDEFSKMPFGDTSASFAAYVMGKE